MRRNPPHQTLEACAQSQSLFHPHFSNHAKAGSNIRNIQYWRESMCIHDAKEYPRAG